MASSDLNAHVQTSRLLLRAPVLEDAPGLAALFQNPETTRYEPRKPANPTAEHYASRIPSWTAMREQGRNCFMVVIKPSHADSSNGNGKLIGMGGINDIMTEHGVRVADMGILLDSSEWRLGYGREALIATVEYAFNEARCGVGIFETDAANKPFRALAKAIGLGDFEQLRSNGEECEFKFTAEQWKKARATQW